MKKKESFIGEQCNFLSVGGSELVEFIITLDAKDLTSGPGWCFYERRIAIQSDL